MKRLAFLMFAAALALLPALCAAKTGLGVQGGFDLSTESGGFFSATWRTDKNPWGAAVSVHPWTHAVTAEVDNWFVYQRLAAHLDYFVLWGVSGGFAKDGADWELTTGPRFGGGVSCCFARRHIELYAQVVWNPYAGVARDDGRTKPVFRPVSFPCAAGVRVWF